MQQHHNKLPVQYNVQTAITTHASLPAAAPEHLPHQKWKISIFRRNCIESFYILSQE